MGGPSGGQPTSVTVSLPSAMLAGDTVQATAVVKDASGNPVNATIAWSTSNAAIATVDALGRVAAGGDASGIVTVIAGVKSASGSADVAIGSDTRLGYAWADQPGVAGPYSPDASYQLNSSGGAVAITRGSIGIYSVRFTGLGRSVAQHDNVQVTGYAGPAGAFCKLGGWQATGADLTVEVRCFTAAGAAADGRYTVLVSGARPYVQTTRLGFALSPDPLVSGPLDAATDRNSASGTITVNRTGPGTYQVTWPGLERVPGKGPETVMVTSVGNGPERCHVVTWDRFAAIAAVGCNGTTGAPADSRFSVLWFSRGRPFQRYGYAWTDMASSTVDYVPDDRFSFNTSTGTVTAQRLGTGQYRLVFAGLRKVGPATETVMVVAYGVSDRTCTTTSWGNSGATDLAIAVACYDPAGTPADAQYDLLLIQ